MDLNNSATSILLIVAIVGYIIYRQVRPRRLSTRGLVIMPLILLYVIFNDWHSFHPTNKEIIDIIISAIVSIALGLIACRELKVYPSPKTGKAMSRGSWKYFLWWLAAFIIKAGVSFAFGEKSFSGINQVEILIPVFFLVSARSAYLYWKVDKLGLELHQRYD